LTGKIRHFFESLTAMFYLNGMYNYSYRKNNKHMPNKGQHGQVREVFHLNITDIRVRRTYQDTRLKALVSVTIDHDLAVHDIKVIEGPERLFVAMPSRKDDNSVFRDICHPITPQARVALESAILSAYHEHLERARAEMEPMGPEAVMSYQNGERFQNYGDPDNAGA